MDNNKLFAAIDLGSVSFHLVIMTRKKGRLVWVDCKKDIIRLASGLDPATGLLSDEIEKKALRTLKYFARSLSRKPITQCKVVGTSTFRKLKDDGAFQKKAEQALGKSIEILSGSEEANYIYRGVSHNLPSEKRIVLDIGGGSTEIIIGDGKNPMAAASIETGCITLTQKYFMDSKIDRKLYELAEADAHQAFKSKSHTFNDLHWDSELGTSGSIKAISWAMQNIGVSDGEITRESIADMRNTILSCPDQLTLSRKIKLNLRRTNVFCGGFILLSQAFKVLGLSYLKVGQGAIREGIIDELIHQSESA